MKKLLLKRFDKSIPIPEYKTKGSVGFDLYARETITIKSKEIVYIPLNIAVKIPDNCFFLLANRSSTHKLGITCVNGIGVGDLDFSGNEDEYKFPAYNFTDSEVIIEKGMRIAQGIIIPFEKVEIEEVDNLDENSRGGFGSTGVY
mgnify:CR=1 FL=1